MYEGNKTGRSWKKLWEHQNGTIEKKEQAPKGTEALEMTIEESDIQIVGSIKETGFLSDQTLTEARALGLI
jgi:hypothetical protein